MNSYRWSSCRFLSISVRDFKSQSLIRFDNSRRISRHSVLDPRSRASLILKRCCSVPPSSATSNNETKSCLDSTNMIPKLVVVSNGIESTTTADPPLSGGIPSSNATTLTRPQPTSKVHKPRLIFPWRHEPPVDNLLPRFVKGTPEFREFNAGGHKRLSAMGQRVAAMWFMNVPLSTALFNFKGWKRELANASAYAFAQGVAGIVSNVYQIPFDTIATGDKISFQYPSTQNNVSQDLSESEDALITSISGEENVSQDLSESEDALITSISGEEKLSKPYLNGTEEAVSKDIADEPSVEKSVTNGTAEIAAKDEESPSTSTAFRGSSLKEEKTPASATDPDTPLTKETAESDFEPETKSATAGDSDTPLTKETADSDIGSKIDPETTPTTTADSESTRAKETVHAMPPGNDSADTSTVEADPKDGFCPQVKDMLIEPLRRLYESAHDSGRDQLIIKLQVELVRAFCVNFMCIPYVTRATAANNPAKLKRMRNLQFNREGFGTIYDELEQELDRSGKLETTIELQVMIVCNEIFQVLDRKTGAVLQGSHDGSVQAVSHLIRLETTAVQELSTNRTIVYCTDWKITDIDDMLGHLAWYQK